MNPHPQPIDRMHFETQQLLVEHPPILRHRNKQIVFEIACPPGSRHTGRLDFSRWQAMSLPPTIDLTQAAKRVVGRAGYYDYAQEPDLVGAVEWHVNFADPHLFMAYGTSLFAQDEMQVAEHPVLGALKEALETKGLAAITVENGKPTPVLVMGAERRCRVLTDPNIAEGRPRGLYGNEFARASAEALRRATTRIDPPTVTNMIAIAAPNGSYGRYTASEIENILITAYTGFHAAMLESARGHGTGRPVAIHTGYWGCGAFGGNRVLMAMLQILAAEMAGLERLIFHTGADAGPLEEAGRLIEGGLANEAAHGTGELIVRIAAFGFEWGKSDGN